MGLSKEREQLIRQRDAAIQEANMWRSELAKAREHDVILEAAVVRAEEKVRVAEANAETRIREAVQRESAALKEKEELLAYVNVLKAQLQRSNALFSFALAFYFVKLDLLATSVFPPKHKDGNSIYQYLVKQGNGRRLLMVYLPFCEFIEFEYQYEMWSIIKPKLT